mmetsp:Transcript_92401/g.188046  ORF Transcript_92401/g.188046 Transcript_92401/m.188046 type:complete len:89 (-) Transcript_92401:362-628(-)
MCGNESLWPWTHATNSPMRSSALDAAEELAGTSVRGVMEPTRHAVASADASPLTDAADANDASVVAGPPGGPKAAAATLAKGDGTTAV